MSDYYMCKPDFSNGIMNRTSLKSMSHKKAIIIGAGSAGLTAAYELLDKTDIKPAIFEMTEDIGGISKTVNYKGNRIDIGGHRFFSKSQLVNQWWQNILPLQGSPAKDYKILGRDVPLSKECYIRDLGKDQPMKSLSPDPEKCDEVFLCRYRSSRIYFLKNFFKYPISVNWETVRYLGPVRIIKILVSYVKARLWSPASEKNLEEFFIKRFGKELYEIFFKSYTEKVWGMPCNKIRAEWGEQRIKGLSVTQAFWHSVRKIFYRDQSVDQRLTETSLIERFFYPKYGPGQMWEQTARLIQNHGGNIIFNKKAVEVKRKGNRIQGIVVQDTKTGSKSLIEGDYFFSNMPVKDLIRAFDNDVPAQVRDVSDGLVYRDFIIVGILVK